MSFASETKKELTQVEADDTSLKAEVSALIRMNGSLSFANRQISLDVQTENAAIARRLYTIVKKLYPYNVELLVRKKMRLKKNNVYICRLREGAREILADLETDEKSRSQKIELLNFAVKEISEAKLKKNEDNEMTRIYYDLLDRRDKVLENMRNYKQEHKTL